MRAQKVDSKCSRWVRCVQTGVLHLLYSPDTFNLASRNMSYGVLQLTEEVVFFPAQANPSDGKFIDSAKMQFLQHGKYSICTAYACSQPVGKIFGALRIAPVEMHEDMQPQA